MWLLGSYQHRDWPIRNGFISYANWWFNHPKWGQFFAKNWLLIQQWWVSCTRSGWSLGDIYIYHIFIALPSYCSGLFFWIKPEPNRGACQRALERFLGFSVIFFQQGHLECRKPSVLGWKKEATVPHSSDVWGSSTSFSEHTKTWGSISNFPD